MLDRIFGNKTHLRLHILGLSGLAAGLPLNKVVLSISMMFLALNFLLEADLKTFWSNLKNNRIFLFVLALFALHLLGLLWTSNFDYAFHDLRAKLPLIIIAIILAGKPVTKTEHREFLLLVFLGALLVTSLINYSSYVHWIGERIYDDIRGMSLFVSHVRYAIMLAFGVGIAIYFFVENKWRPLMIVLILWFSYYTFYSQIISGMLTLSGILLVLPVFFFGKKRPKLLVFLYSLLTIPIIWGSLWMLTPMDIDPDDYVNLDLRTSEGNNYRHDFDCISVETGKPVGLYFCEVELRREWNKRSKIDFDARDIRGNLVKENLRRYMASKDLRKDAQGVKQLSLRDIHKIESGCASVYCKGILARLYGLKYQLVNAEDPNGHSFLQRIEYWKTGVKILKENSIIGVGTGDVQDAFDEQYEQDFSVLTKENRRRTHNQFLTIWITFGIAGIVLFLWLHISFLRLNWNIRSLVPLMFGVVILLSYLVEDTLETQIGITFFAFFIMIYSVKPDESSKESSLN